MLRDTTDECVACSRTAAAGNGSLQGGVASLGDAHKAQARRRDDLDGDSEMTAIHGEQLLA